MDVGFLSDLALGSMDDRQFIVCVITNQLVSPDPRVVGVQEWPDSALLGATSAWFRHRLDPWTSVEDADFSFADYVTHLRQYVDQQRASIGAMNHNCTVRILITPTHPYRQDAS